ncbi:TPA: EAL domain-containing protein [Raoultella planticola]|nr:EAL domain-containing protein [Raoultella planticola]
MKKLRYSRHLLITFTCFVSVNFFGILFTWKDLHNQQLIVLKDNLQKTTIEIDALLTHAKQASIQAIDLTKLNCDNETRTQMRTIQASIPDVRSVNLVKKNKIYCSSIYGPRNLTVNEKDYISGQLKIKTGNETTPNDAFISYRYAMGEDSVITVINGYDFYHLLNAINTPYESYLKIGPNFMDNTGKVFTHLPEHSIQINSPNFNYALLGNMSDEPLFTLLKKYRAWSLLTIFLLSMIISYLTFSKLRSRVNMKSILKESLYTQQFSTYIQPIIDAETGKIAGGELLMRWSHPELGFISPDKFIPVAEESNMIISLTDMSMKAVIYEFDNVKLIDPLFLCFNVSSYHFSNKQIVKICNDFIEKANPKIRLVLEITERENIQNSEETRLIINTLKGMNIEFSIDDFGTGNSNLNYITLFSPSFIKIDKHFTKDITEITESQLLVQSISSIAHNFSCKTIAEGIEEEVQYEIMKSLKIDYIQGYFTGRPTPLKDFVKKLTN